MTGREWQYGLYVTDRWQASDKLTLNVGLRFEFYPLMKRADRGIERLDLATYEVLLGGLGGTPEDVGINLKKFYVAPRLGAAYRFTDDTVLRAGYGRTFNPLPWSRPMRGSFPFDIFFNQTAEQYGSFPIQSGIPPVPIPDLELRTGEAAAEHLHPDSQPERRGPRHHPADERRGRAPTARGHLGGAGLRPHPHRRRLRRPRRQPLRARRRTSRPQVLRPGRHTAINDWASRTKSRYHGLQVALNRPFRNGLLLKGAYTLSRSKNETSNDEDGWAGLTWNHPALLGQELRPRRLRPDPRLPDGVHLRAAFRQAVQERSGPDRPELADQRHRCRLLGHTVLDHRHQPGGQLSRLRNHPDQRERRPQTDGHARLGHRALVRQGGLLAAHRRQPGGGLRNEPAQPVPQSRRLERGPGVVPLVPDRPLSGRRSASRPPTCSTTPTGPGRTSASRPPSS